MGALHVVGEDFEFGFEVGFGALAHQQRLGGLAAVGLVGALRDGDAALIDGARLAAGDLLEKLGAGGVGHGVGDVGGDVGMRRAAQNRDAREMGGRVGAG